MIEPQSLHGSSEDPPPLRARGKYPPTNGGDDGDDPTITGDSHISIGRTNERPHQRMATQQRSK